jgi:two-component sensor histidine kinase
VLDFTWRERGGAPVEKPGAEGFGTNFIKRSLAYEMGGSAEIRYDPSGIECRLRLPLRSGEGGRDEI